MQKFFLIQDVSLIEEDTLVSQLSDRPYFIFCDSNDESSNWNEFSFIGVDPLMVLEVKDHVLTIRNRLDDGEYLDNRNDKKEYCAERAEDASNSYAAKKIYKACMSNN